jgi:Acetyltransferase (GNAT) domain
MTDLPEDWDAWMRDAGADASFGQTGHWARIHETINGAAPYCLEVRDGGRRIAAALFGYRRQNSATLRDLATAAIKGRGGALECFGGPVITSAAPLPALERILDEADRLARRLMVRQVTFSAPPTTARWPLSAGMESVFAARGFRATSWLTSLVEVARPDNAMLASFRQSARKGIRRCQELGIAVRECCDAADYLENFSHPLFATRRSLGLAIRPEIENAQWWDIDRTRQYRYFIALDRDGRVLGTLGTYRWNGVATEIMSERTMPAREARMPVQDLLHWHAFRTHRDLGDRLFDLAGYAPAPANPKEEGIRSFKEKWAGRPVAIPRFERRSEPLQYRVARSIYRKLGLERRHAG